MTINDYLEIRERERHHLLLRIVDVLKRDRRVSAAWLSGSVSRGDDDGLSDLDPWVVVSDESIDDFVKDRRKYASQHADPILMMDNIRNAPPGGAYMLALYAGKVGPQHVDWFWQPESRSQLPDDEKLLFDRVGLQLISGAKWRKTSPRPPGHPLPRHSTHTQLLTHKIAFFWAMSTVAAKYIARQHREEAARMTALVARTLSETVQLAELSGPNRDLPLSASLRSETLAKQFNMLLELARNAKTLHQVLVEQGATIPSEAIPHIYRFYELTRSIMMSR